MSEQSIISIKCLVLDDSVIYADAIEQVLVREPGMEVAKSHTGFGEGLRAARKLHPDVILVAGDTPGVGSLVESLDEAVPQAPVIVVFAGDEPELARECVLAGAQLCLYGLEDQEQLIASVHRLVARERRRRTEIVAQAAGGQQKLARVIAFHAAKGGSGTTTMLVNSAVALASHTKKRVVVVDAAMQSSDVGVFMDINHSASITDLLPHMKELDSDLVTEILATHESGVQVLLAPAELERAELLTAEQFGKILGVLRKSADYILIDTPPVLDAVSMVALDAADQIVLVSTPEVAALRNTARFMQLGSKLGYPPEKLFLLLNRAGSKGGIRKDDLQQHLKQAVGLQVRSAGRQFVNAANKGAPLASGKGRFGPGKAFRQLAVILDSSERTSKRQERARRAAWLKVSRDSAKAGAKTTSAV